MQVKHVFEAYLEALSDTSEWCVEGEHKYCELMPWEEAIAMVVLAHTSAAQILHA